MAKMIITIAICSVWLSLSASTNAADTPPGNDNGQDEESLELQTVVVTAEKRSTELQKTPIAITVLTEQDLEDNNIKTIRDVLKLVPSSLQVDDFSGNTKISFRGALASSATETNPLVMYIDGVPVDSFAFLDANLLNIEQIEILRGAQGAIYGKNAFAGVVNITSKQPGNNPESKVFAQAGSETSYGFGATVSGPVVTDRLFFSFTSSYDDRDGFMEHPNSSESNFERTGRVKGQLRFLPNVTSEISLYMDYTEKRKGFIPYTLGDSPSLESPASDTDFRDDDITNVALHGSFDFGEITLKSITSYRKDIMQSSLDTDPIFTPLYGAGFGGLSFYHDESVEQTQELRLQNSEATQKNVNWLLGLYGGNRDFDRKLFNLVKNSVEETDYPYQEETRELAAFTQVEVPLTDDFEVTAGLRWQTVERSASLSFEKFKVPVFKAEPSETWTELLPKLVFSYDIADDYMVYVGVNKSFLPGGFNRATQSGEADYTYEPQIAWNYEMGTKTSWFDKRLNANLTLFYSKYRDMQVQQWDTVTQSTFAENAAETTAFGSELELDAQISSALRVQAVLGYTDAKYDEFISKTALGNVDYSENRVELIPEYTGNLFVIYRNENSLVAQASAQYISKIYWAAENTDYRDDLVTANAKIGYETESFDIHLFANNLFDQHYQITYSSILDTTIMAPPREVGIRLVGRF